MKLQHEVDGLTTEEMIETQAEFGFGEAINFLKEGHRVTRSGWNGKDMWIVLMPELFLDAGIVNARTTKHIGEGVNLDSQPYIAMFTATGQWQPGWTASQSDILSEDWIVLAKKEEK